jgi:hypothetical protein
LYEPAEETLLERVLEKNKDNFFDGLEECVSHEISESGVIRIACRVTRSFMACGAPIIEYFLERNRVLLDVIGHVMVYSNQEIGSHCIQVFLEFLNQAENQQKNEILGQIPENGQMYMIEMLLCNFFDNLDLWDADRDTLGVLEIVTSILEYAEEEMLMSEIF